MYERICVYIYSERDISFVLQIKHYFDFLITSIISLILLIVKGNLNLSYTEEYCVSVLQSDINSCSICLLITLRTNSYAGING